LTEYRHELSNTGIRVDKESVWKQLEYREANLDYQKAVLADQLPLSFGGGLNISRLFMLLLRTGHIGEVSVGVWHDRQSALSAG
jgi:aspartate--ammonia ligase